MIYPISSSYIKILIQSGFGGEAIFFFYCDMVCHNIRTSPL